MWTMSRSLRALPAALLAAGLLVSAPACSVQTYAVRSGPYVDIERRAHDNGYREGFEEGRSDARHHRSFSFERHGEYRDAERGYRRDYERGAYRHAFRRGFEAGYREGFDRFAREYRR